jgi:replicative DNA helicase
MQTVKELMDEAIDLIKNPVFGLPTGLKKLTDVTRGYCPGQLIIIAGRSSMGKTAFSCDCMLAQKVKVLVFSLEMSSVVLIQRMIANRANVDYRKLIDNNMNDKEKGRVNEAVKFLRNVDIHIDDTPCLTPEQFVDKCDEHPDAKLIVVDHLHLMRHEDGRLGPVQAYDDITKRMRDYAKVKQVPIVLLCQLNRKADDRDSHEPKLSDLRDSGAIEQNADIVLLMYRPSYYMQREIDPNVPDDGECQIIVAKQRNGVTGSIKAVFIGEFMSFRDCAQQTMDDWRK